MFFFLLIHTFEEEEDEENDKQHEEDMEEESQEETKSRAIESNSETRVFDSLYFPRVWFFFLENEVISRKILQEIIVLFLQLFDAFSNLRGISRANEIFQSLEKLIQVDFPNVTIPTP